MVHVISYSDVHTNGTELSYSNLCGLGAVTVREYVQSRRDKIDIWIRYRSGHGTDEGNIRTVCVVLTTEHVQ